MDQFQFHIDVADKRPFCHKPIAYPPKAREWLLNYMQSLERLGIVRKVNTLVEPAPTFTCSVVLVPEG